MPADSSPAAAPQSAPSTGMSRKKIIVIAGVVLLIVAVVAETIFLLKARHPETAAASTAEPAKTAKHDPHAKPNFVPFDSFTVNLNDRDNERFAQVVFSIETADSATGELVKAQMPAIRGRVLIALSSMSSKDLMGREGKERLAKEILVETRKALQLPEDDKSLVEVYFSQFVMQ